MEWNRRYIATSCGVKTYTIVGKGKPPATFSSDTFMPHNDSSQPSTQRASSIRSTHGKYNPSRALVDSFCLLSTTIVAFCNRFQLNWSDVETSESQSSSFASLPSSHGHTQRAPSQTTRVWCIGSWVGVIDSLSVGLRLAGLKVVMSHC